MSAVKAAYSNMKVCSTFQGNHFAFNRRYWMKNGKVMTNPGIKNPDIESPEGAVDENISVLAVKQNGKLTTLMVKLCNHTDTVGGDLVSADWMHGA
ncbi:MAG: hypothetical protein GY750_10565 [Lentisphaerae bacterium]|nr:hypothetical protein [Lentisphaerota bacterium]MCP4101853.1 hypothetical protein [Lentisphaerota bacterium]